MTKRLDFDFVKSKFDEKNYILLEDNYKNANTKMRYVCSLHKEKGVQTITYGSLYSGSGCRTCGGIKTGDAFRFDIKFVKKQFSNEGYILLEDKYINAQQKLKYICNNHPDDVSEINNIQQGKRCPLCAQNKKKTIDEAKTIFKELGFTLLEDEYINSKTKMRYLCNKHPEFIQKSSLNAIQTQKFSCSICNTENMKSVLSLSEYDVRNRLMAIGYVYIGGYINSKGKISFLCPKHPELIQESNFHSLSTGASRCKACGKDSFSKKTKKENHWNWKGGISSISAYLRNEIFEWRIDSLIKYNLKCVVSGQRADVVHHLYPFHKIVTEAFNFTRIKQKEEINMYSENELLLLSNEVNRLHYKYGLGVPLKKDLHLKFHSLYGNTDFTPECFEEFRRSLTSLGVAT